MKLPVVISLRKALPIWAIPNGHLNPGGVAHVLEVHVGGLGGFGPQVGDGGVVFNWAYKGSEHGVEHAGIGEFGAVVRAAPVGHVVFAEAAAAGWALHQRVREVFDMAGHFPDARVHEDGGVEADNFGARVHDAPPPSVFDIADQFGAQRTVVPGAGEAAVDLGAGKDEPSALGQGGERVKVGSGHSSPRV